MIHCIDHSQEQTNIFNIGSQDFIDVTKIADIVVESMGLPNVSYRYTGGPDGRGWRGDVKVMLLSIEAIRNLGWRPKHNSSESIKEAVKSLLRDDTI